MLMAYAAGTLDPSTAAALEQHLAVCAACRSLADEQIAMWKALDIWEAPSVSPDFDRRLYSRIDSEVRLSWWERLARPFRPMPLRQTLPLAASACLLLMAGLICGIRAPSRPYRRTVKSCAQTRWKALLTTWTCCASSAPPTPRKAGTLMPCDFGRQGLSGSDGRSCRQSCWWGLRLAQPVPSRKRRSLPGRRFWRIRSTGGTGCPPRSANANSPSCRPTARG